MKVKACTFLTLLLLLFTINALCESTMSVYFLDVGQGNAAFVCCDGQTMMIDGADSSQSQFIYSFIQNNLQLSHIDHIIATTPHDEHIGGLSAAMNVCSVSQCYAPVASYASKAFSALQKNAKQHGISIQVPNAELTFNLGSAFVRLIPLSVSNQSVDPALCVLVTHGDTTFFFTGDLDQIGEQLIIDRSISSSVLQVGCHGSANASTGEFLRHVKPQYAVISTGKNNTEGTPDDAVLKRLTGVKAQLLRTDLCGTIVFQSTKDTLTCQTEREYTPTVTTSPSSRYIANPSAPKPTKKPESAYTTQSSSSSSRYIYNKNTKKFHYSSCSSVKKMKESNKGFSNDRNSLINMGYSPCKICNP